MAKERTSKTKSIVAGVSIGLAVIMSAGAVALAGKSLGWYDNVPKKPEATIEALNFEETVYGTYSVSLKDYEAKEIVIPEKYKGKKVTEIGGMDAAILLTLSLAGDLSTAEAVKTGVDEALSQFTSEAAKDNAEAMGFVMGEIGFCFATKLTKITIPESIKKIESGAFLGCYSLTEINIPDSVQEIGDCCFAYNAEAEKIEISENLKTAGAADFSYCVSLKEVKIPKMEVLSGTMFQGCIALEKAVIPEGVKKISGSVFKGCTGLKEVVLARTLESIGTDAFNNCTSLKTVYNLSKIELTKGADTNGKVAKYAEKIYTEYPASSEGMPDSTSGASTSNAG